MSTSALPQSCIAVISIQGGTVGLVSMGLDPSNMCLSDSRLRGLYLNTGLFGKRGLNDR